MAMPIREPDNLLQQALALIESENSQDRRQGYNLLYYQAEVIARDLSPTDGMRVIEAVKSEHDSDMRQLGTSAIHALLIHRALLAIPQQFSSMLKDADEATKQVEGMPMCDWLWGEFERESALIHAKDPGHLVRDELAVIEFARCLGRNGLRQTVILPFSTSDVRAHRAVVDPKYIAFCMVGRPGLLGDKFLKDISLPSRLIENQKWLPTRFAFTIHRRPLHLPRIRIDGEQSVDHEYNFLVEQLGDGTRVRYETREFDGQREDWGLVQRYTIEISEKKRTIVICAGGSSLGTLAAAMWACDALFPDLEDSRSKLDAIRMPKDSTNESRMEALIRATADTGLPTWESPKIELVKLYVDDFSQQTSGGVIEPKHKMWENKKWIVRPPDEITLVGSPDRPTAILLDREPSRSINGGKMFTLMAILANSKLVGEAEVSIQELLANEELFGDGGDNLVGLTNLLYLIRTRYLSTAMLITPSAASIQCKVRQIDNA